MNQETEQSPSPVSTDGHINTSENASDLLVLLYIFRFF